MEEKDFNVAMEVHISAAIAVMSVALMLFSEQWLWTWIGSFFISFPYVFQFINWAGTDEQKEEEGWRGPGCNVLTIAAILALLVFVVFLVHGVLSQDLGVIVRGWIHGFMGFSISAAGMVVTSYISGKL